MKHWNEVRAAGSHPLITGTLILTATGLASRIIGFLYRIFLTHTIGAEGLGMCQLVLPVFTLALALCAGGMQTAITKFTAESDSMQPLRDGLCICIISSLLCAAGLYANADFLAVTVIGDGTCAPLLRIISLSLPFACIHACFNGYYYGKKKTTVPAVSQLLEQVVRVFCVYLFFRICTEQSLPLTPALTLWGTVCAEAAATLFCVTTFRIRRSAGSPVPVGRMLHFAAPLTASRLVLNLFAGAEAILIPRALLSAGNSRSAALSIFGTLNGMALPVILLPTVLTGSLSVLLLPQISEAAAAGDRARTARITRRTVELCAILGLTCTLGLLLFGRLIGRLLFHSALAGSYITALSFLCPFLFLDGTLGSILHGFGFTRYTFFLSLCACALRLFAILSLVPHFGLYVYLWSLLLGHIMQSAAYLHKLSHL